MIRERRPAQDAVSDHGFLSAPHVAPTVAKKAFMAMRYV
jgi:hypothetical protein